MNFQEELRKYVTTAFSNEEKFINWVCDIDNVPVREPTLDSFYMASERCMYRILGVNLYLETTIRTDDFIAWCNEINGED